MICNISFVIYNAGKCQSFILNSFIRHHPCSHSHKRGDYIETFGRCDIILTQMLGKDRISGGEMRWLLLLTTYMHVYIQYIGIITMVEYISKPAWNRPTKPSSIFSVTFTRLYLVWASHKLFIWREKASGRLAEPRSFILTKCDLDLKVLLIQSGPGSLCMTDLRLMAFAESHRPTFAFAHLTIVFIVSSDSNDKFIQGNAFNIAQRDQQLLNTREEFRQSSRLRRGLCSKIFERVVGSLFTILKWIRLAVSSGYDATGICPSSPRFISFLLFSLRSQKSSKSLDKNEQVCSDAYFIHQIWRYSLNVCKCRVMDECMENVKG